MSTQRLQLHRIVDWVSGVFPHALITLASPSGNDGAGTTGGASRAIEATGKMIARLPALESHALLVRSTSCFPSEEEEEHEWVCPRLAPHRLCCDLVVTIGGYEGVDLSRSISKLMLDATPNLGSGDSGEMPPTVDREQLAINKKKYWREWSVKRTSVQTKGSRLLADCFMACPDVAVSGGLLDAHRRVTVFIGFCNPETSMPTLNAATRDVDRRHLRPAFGYSQEVLKRTLRQDVLTATRGLLRRAASLSLDSNEASTEVTERGLPPAFVLSACARIAAEGKTRQDDDASAQAIQRAVAVELAQLQPQDLKVGSKSPLMENFFLPGEVFSRLAAVELWASAPERAKTAALFGCGSVP